MGWCMGVCGCLDVGVCGGGKYVCVWVFLCVGVSVCLDVRGCAVNVDVRGCAVNVDVRGCACGCVCSMPLHVYVSMLYASFICVY